MTKLPLLLTASCLTLLVPAASPASTPHSHGSAAAGPLTVRTLSLSQAMAAANAALDACRSKRYAVSVAVVDHDGGIKLLLRDDRAAELTLDAARRKAYTAANTGVPTTQFEQFLRAHPELGTAHHLADFLALGGGLPVKVADEIVGGIGVSGAPTIGEDDACAQAGLDAIDRPRS
jgi:uncharacterized protein GlcG (DUF336 family)